jgi:sugar phosphate isomerase/epimerase
MKTGFMSSVAPRRTLPELIATATAYGYDGVEFRAEWGHGHGVELTATGEQRKSARRMLRDGGVAASCVATSVKFNSPTRTDHLPQRETLRRYIALAADIGAPCVRTFSDPVPEDDEAARDDVLHLAAESYAALDAWARQHEVQVTVETHSNLRAHWARSILDTAHVASLRVLWDPGHHVSRGQSVGEAYGYLERRVAHVHFRAPSEGDRLTDADNLRVIQLLRAEGFDGFLSVEVINPLDSDAVLAHHRAKLREALAT